MPSFHQDARIIITCNKRLSIYLEKEVKELGFKIVRAFSSGIELKGTLNDCMWLNLNLRCASQVLYSIRSFECNNPTQLYEAAASIEWENIFEKDGYFSVTSTVDHPTINNSLFANVKVKDAIVDRFRQKMQERPNSGSDLSRTVIHLFWKDETAEIFIDTSGETLAKHGYRKIPGKAPMLEGLASATLLATNWNFHSPFINPMCGSGTIAIEAALMATNRRPGLFRDNYGFKHLLEFDVNFYQKRKKSLFEQIIDLPGLEIVASDVSVDAINISRINAAAAGVEALIQFKVCDFADTPSRKTNRELFISILNMAKGWVTNTN